MKGHEYFEMTPYDIFWRPILQELKSVRYFDQLRIVCADMDIHKELRAQCYIS